MKCDFPTVNKFLCRLKLETGGLVIGWFVAVFFGISAILLTGVLIMEAIGFKKGYSSSIAEDFQAGTTARIIIEAITIVFLIFGCISGMLLIKGTKNQNHKQMVPFLIMMISSIVITIIDIAVFGVFGVIIAIIWLLLDIYILLCIYSLYKSVADPLTMAHRVLDKL